jgi:hypothetical protein
MVLTRSFLRCALIFSAASFAACNFSVSTSDGVELNVAGFEKETPEDVAAFSEDVMRALYDKDKAFLIKHADPEVVDDFTPELFAFLFQMQQPTARPDLAVTVGSEYRKDKALRDFVTLYHVPTEIGRDYVHVGVRADDDICCKISTVNFNVKYGKEHKMNIYKPKPEAEGVDGD